MNLIKKMIIKNYNLNKEIFLYFSEKKKLIYIKGLYGYVVIKIPNYFYFLKDKNKLKLIFNKKSLFIYLIKNIDFLYNKIIYIYNVRLKLRGLGFKIRKVSKNLYYFFFNYINMFYFYLPKNLLMK
jgi:hypothetical protein